MTPERAISATACALATCLPEGTLEAVADAIQDCPGNTLRTEIARVVPHHQHRDLVQGYLDTWQREAPKLDAQSVSLALRTAALTVQAHRESQSIELVWTGPDTEEHAFRRTEQAILQVLDGAKRHITLVSFAVYKIPHIAQALVRAARRGVRLAVIVETPDKLESENEYSTLRALGPEIAACATVYFWPKDKRQHGDNLKPGILHVKCVVADGEWLFLSSANLTQQAFTINMELGTLIRGGTAPKQVESHFAQLIRDGYLRPIG